MGVFYMEGFGVAKNLDKAEAMLLKAEIPSSLAFRIFFKSDLPIDLTIFDSVNCAMCIRPSGTMQGSHRFIQTFQDIKF